MKKILISLVAIASMAVAEGGCVLSQSADMNVTWKAYKTFSKLGVGGQFTNVNYSPIAKEGKNFEELLVDSNVSIDVMKIDTKNPARDETLVENFFGKLEGDTITGTVTAVKANKREKGKAYTGTLDINMTMNEKSMMVPMTYHFDKEEFKAKGVIDLFDFSASEALASINKSCFALHNGKTWNDVSIGFTLNIKAALCDVKVDEIKK